MKLGREDHWGSGDWVYCSLCLLLLSWPVINTEMGEISIDMRSTAISILSTLYTGGQVLRHIHELYTGKHFIHRRTSAMVDFIGDQVWRLFFGDDRRIGVRNFSSWFVTILSQTQTGIVSNIVIIIWGLWNHHHGMVWDRNRSPAAAILASSLQEQRQWSMIQSQHLKYVNHQVRLALLKRRKRSLGLFLCNVDACVFADGGHNSFGFLAQDQFRYCSYAHYGSFYSLFARELSEALAFKEALSWIKSSNIGGIEIQSDCFSMIQAINNSNSTYTCLSKVIYDCIILLRDICNCSISFIKHSTNMAANSLA
ncbi:uncharacterized protein [Euphorbia lathyris]|uniref:uncharacterized protein isoform X2 n=1 Tax=Euphorbia lathyris TaxID=212925 RepID=UPI003313B584